MLNNISSDTFETLNMKEENTMTSGNDYDKKVRQLEFYALDYLLNTDPFNIASRNIIEITDDEELVYLRNQALLNSLCKNLIDIENAKSSEAYRVATVNYEKIVKKVNYLARELSVSNSLEISLLFSYLLYNGYFSITSKHRYQMEKGLYISGKYSFDIFFGRGTCLNYTDMLVDILTDAGYDSAIMINYMSKGTKSENRPDIKRNIAQPQIHTRISRWLERKNVIKTGNHACALIIDNDSPYIYDSTNLTMFECINNKETVHNLGSGKLVLKPYLSSLYVKSEENYNAIKKFCLSDDYTSPYDKKDFIFTSEKCIDTFDSNKEKINDFYNDIFSNITEIVHDIKIKKKTRR